MFKLSTLENCIFEDKMIGGKFLMKKLNRLFVKTHSRHFHENQYTILKREKKIFLQYSAKELREMKKNLLTKFQNHDEERAKNLIKLGKYNEAKELLTTLNPNTESLALLGSQFLIAKEMEKAKETFHKSIEIDPENGLLECIKSIFSLENSSCYPFALELCETILKKNPQNNKIQTLKKDVSNALLNELSKESLEPLTRFRPFDWLVHFKYSSVLKMNNANNEEVAEYLKLSISLTDNYIPRYYYGVISFEMKEYETSEKMFQNVIDINDRSDSVSLYHLADAYSRLLRFEDTLKCLNKSLEISPRNYFSNRLRGITLLRVNQPNEALYDLEIAFGSNPDNFESLYFYSVALLECGKHEEALKKFNECIETFPNEAKAWFERGLCLYQLFIKNKANEELGLKYFTDALHSFEKSISVDETFCRSYFAIGMMYDGLGDKEKALEYVNKGLTYDNKEPSGIKLKQKLEST
jgi:tetratricopeptide (TPR) repeat protein